jgi:DNA-binding NtrC family response regulator
MDHSLLVVDDEEDFLDTMKRVLALSGFRKVRLERDSVRAAALVEEGADFDLALIDITMPGVDGVSMLERIKRRSPETECIMVTALNEARTAVDCLKKGAYDYLVKPITREALISGVRRALEGKNPRETANRPNRPGTETLSGLMHPDVFKPICTRSAAMLRLLREAELHAASDVPILITGESGTGKDLLARAIHEASPRARRPFTPLNMASLSGTLIDAEFFGHTRGAFTGAEKDRSGYLEYTDGGTLFLDEIGDLPLEFQGKLLRVLQDGEFLKLGTNRPQKADVRFVAATNRDLERSMEKGSFRRDLYYRLKGVRLGLPPLRDRKEDIPLLVDSVLDNCRKSGKKLCVDGRVLSLLMTYDYPGNIRELKSILQAAVNLAQEGPISPHCLPEFLRDRSSARRSGGPTEPQPVAPLGDVEREHILKAYVAARRNKCRTARLLGIGLNTLRRKLDTFGIN